MALFLYGCFCFLPKGFRRAKDDRYSHLHFVYTIRLELAHKSLLVYDCRRVNPRGLSTCTTVVKVISVQLLDIIVESQGLHVLAGDIRNAFIQASTTAKVYTCVFI